MNTKCRGYFSGIWYRVKSCRMENADERIIISADSELKRSSEEDIVYELIFFTAGSLFLNGFVLCDEMTRVRAHLRACFSVKLYREIIHSYCTIPRNSGRRPSTSHILQTARVTGSVADSIRGAVVRVYSVR